MNNMAHDLIKRVFKSGKLDRRARITTYCSLGLFIVVVTLFAIFGTAGGYFTAWIATLILAFAALLVFSIPLSVDVSFGAVNIRCVVELTHIPIGGIAEVRTIGPEYCKRFVPLLGSCGFFGYFGFYLDLSDRSVYRVYCRNRRDLVLITTVDERRFIVSCAEAERLAELIEETKNYHLYS